MAAHQRESSSCYPATSSTTAPKEIRDAEAALRDACEEAKRLAAGGSFEDIESCAKAKAAAVKALKLARQQSRQDKKDIRELAQASLSAAGWTQALLDGEEARFAKAEAEAIEGRLAAETVGLVSASAFREKRAMLEADAADQQERRERKEAEAVLEQRQRKRAKKQQQEREQKRGLSFVEEDGP